MWPDERVRQLVEANFTPVRVHVRDQADEFQRLGTRYNAQWTPATLVIDETGTERHRVEGFLPADDLLAQLELGVAKVAFAKHDWGEAERHFRSVVDSFPRSDAAPEGAYWTGVARYKSTNDPKVLAKTARELSHTFPNTPWAKKASVWAPS